MLYMAFRPIWVCLCSYVFRSMEGLKTHTALTLILVLTLDSQCPRSCASRGLIRQVVLAFSWSCAKETAKGLGESFRYY